MHVLGSTLIQVAEEVEAEKSEKAKKAKKADSASPNKDSTKLEIISEAVKSSESSRVSEALVHTESLTFEEKTSSEIAVPIGINNLIQTSGLEFSQAFRDVQSEANPATSTNTNAHTDNATSFINNLETQVRDEQQSVTNNFSLSNTTTDTEPRLESIEALVDFNSLAGNLGVISPSLTSLIKMPASTSRKPESLRSRDIKLSGGNIELGEVKEVKKVKEIKDPKLLQDSTSTSQSPRFSSSA